MLGIWKDYDELESSLCMQELAETLNIMRKKELENRKFMAALKGIDLDDGNEEEEDPWQAMKERVFGGKNAVRDDIMYMQDQGIQYEEVVA